MSGLTDETLVLLDELYPPTQKAIDQRQMLIDVSKAPSNELPYYVAQLSIMLTLIENLTSARTTKEMREHVFQASVAFTVALGLMNAALVSSEGTVN